MASHHPYTPPAPEPREDGNAFHWRAHEYAYHEKGADWYWVLGIIAVALFVVALLLNSILFAIFIVLAAFSMVLFGARKPEIVTFSANRRGLQINNKLYPYQNLEYFWVDEESDEKILIIEPRKKTMPLVVVPIGDADPTLLSDFLLQYLPEEFIERPWSQILMDRIGF